MKRLTSFIAMTVLLFWFESCKKENQLSAFTYQKAAGIWVPYEKVSADGTVHGSPISSSLFGVYAESVQLNADKSFIPVIWTDSNNFLRKLDEQGTYVYNTDQQKLIFDGVWHFEFGILQFTAEELWLKIGTETIKFRKH